jgi:hypothetical protein
MATRKIETPESLVSAAVAAAQSAITATAKARGFSKTFCAKVLALGCYATPEAAKAAEALGKGLEALGTGGKGYASNAKRILAAGPVACQKAIEFCTDPANGGYMAPGNLFKKFPDDFPALTDSGRAKKATPVAPEGVDLGQPTGWLVALDAIRAKAAGQKAWKSDDIVALQDSASAMIALIKRNKV